MRILEILESISNTGKIFDMLRNDREIYREIRQVYNKLRKKRNISSSEIRYTKNWAEFTLTIDRIKNNEQLRQMLNEIIRYCS
jgi:uncharacterized protein YlxP (DUF503 family)